MGFVELPTSIMGRHSGGPFLYCELRFRADIAAHYLM